MTDRALIYLKQFKHISLTRKILGSIVTYISLRVLAQPISNNIRLRWWTDSDQSSVIHTFGHVLEAVYKKLDENGIDMPYPRNVTLFHDQTEENDCNRAKQREGLPAGNDDVPKTDRIAQAVKVQKPDSP